MKLKLIKFALSYISLLLGLPHAHMEIWLADEDAPKTVEDYDRFISAEIPDPVKEPELHALVKKFMIHGPCGTINPNSQCMHKKPGDDKKHCEHKFPKDFSEHTTKEAEFKKPKYRRRSEEQGGKTVQIKCSALGPNRMVKVDNQWVVPYSPYLLRKYGCHINLEIVGSVLGIKYITKYMCKGSDR